MNKKSNNTPFNFDYSRIKDKVSENLRKPAPQQSECDAVPQQPKRKPLWKRVCIMVTCAVLLIALGCGGTLGVQKAFAETEQEHDYHATFTYKRDYVMSMFDMFVSYGHCRLETILQSNLLYEDDKDALLHAIFSKDPEEWKEEWDYTNFEIYLGEKDAKNYVVLHSNQSPVMDFMFRSKIQYSLQDVVKKFEELSGTKLTEEFLCGTTHSKNYLEIYTDGITISFAAESVQYEEKGKYCNSYRMDEIYCAVINNHVYVVTRGLLMGDRVFGETVVYPATGI